MRRLGRRWRARWTRALYRVELLRLMREVLGNIIPPELERMRKWKMINSVGYAESRFSCLGWFLLDFFFSLLLESRLR